MNSQIEPRLMNLAELQAYIGLGRNKALDFGKASGARVSVGRRILYDRIVVDRYIDSLTVLNEDEEDAFK